MLALALASPGCSASTNGVLASAGDFADYRTTRVEPTLELRLAAAQRYLEARPGGSYRDEVRAWFERAEELYYQSKRGSRTGLRAYLDALPQGPHHEEATARLAEFETRDSDLDRTAAAVTAKLSGRGAMARANTRREVLGWLTRWLDHSAFEKPLEEATAELVTSFALALPTPRCKVTEDGAGARCTKLVELPFQVEGKSGLEDHEITLEIAVRLDRRGKPLEVTLSGPDLFLRLEETYRIRALAPDDEADRSAATARAVALARKTFRLRVSDAPACVHRADPPAALRLGCAGLQLELFAGAGSGLDDVVTIVPVQP